MARGNLSTVKHAVIYEGFCGWGWSAKCLDGPIFRGWNEMLLFGKALKFGVIYQKYALELRKICKIIEKIREQMEISGFFDCRAMHIFFHYG